MLRVPNSIFELPALCSRFLYRTGLVVGLLIFFSTQIVFAQSESVIDRIEAVEQISDVSQRVEAAVTLLKEQTGNDDEAYLNRILQLIKGDIPRLQGVGSQVDAALEAGEVFHSGRKYDAALLFYTMARDAAKKGRDSLRLAHAYYATGKLHRERSENYKAEEALSTALVIYRSHGTRVQVADAYSQLGTLKTRLGEYDKAIALIQNALSIHQYLQEPRGIASNHNQLGGIYLRMGEYKQALIHLEQSIDMFDEAGAGAEKLSPMLNTAGIYRGMGEYEDALDQYEDILDLANSIGNARYTAIALQGRGSARQALGQYGDAASDYLTALSITDSLEMKSLKAHLYNNLGNVQDLLGNSERAMEYYEACLDLRQEMGDKRGIAEVENNIATLLEQRGDISGALARYERGLSINRELSNRSGIIFNLVNITYIHIQREEYEEALEGAEEALMLAQLTDDRRSEQFANRYLGVVYLNTGDHNKALQHAQRSLELAEDLGSVEEQMKSHEELTKIYAALKRSEEAQEAFSKYRSLRDSLQSESVTQKVTELETLYETREKQREIESLQREKDIQRLRFRAVQDSLETVEQLKRVAELETILLEERRQRELDSVDQRNYLDRLEDRQRIQELELDSAQQKAKEDRIAWIANVSIGGGVLIFVVAVIFFLLYRSKKRAIDLLRNTQEQLITQEKLASLGQLTAGIAHEIQNPLNFVNNFSDVARELAIEGREDILENNSLDDAAKVKELKALLKDIEGNSTRVNEHGQRASNIVKQMLMHAHTSTGEPVDVDVNTLLSEVVALAYHGKKAQGEIGEMEIEKAFDETGAVTKADPQDLSRVFVNILNNAFDAMGEKREKAGGEYQPRIVLKTESKEHGIVIHIRDNGPGIPTQALEDIFQPFFTTKPSGKGTGLGLSLSHDIIVKKLGGKLDVRSKQNEFTEFVIELPTA